jgi:hypothetical protein
MRLQRAVILIGILAILCVQLLPMFEDPTPLTKVRQPYAPVVVVFLLLSLSVIARRRVADCGETFESPVPLLELTGVRLC